MINILARRWRRVAWFMASLLTAVLVSFTSHGVQPNTAVAVSPKTVMQSSFSSAGMSTAFKEVAASHLEPNFYQ